MRRGLVALAWIAVASSPSMSAAAAEAPPTSLVFRNVRVFDGKSSGLSEATNVLVTGNRIVKAYNLEEKVVEHFKNVSHRFISSYMRIVRSQEIPGPLIEFFGAIGVAALFVYFAFQPSPDA